MIKGVHSHTQRCRGKPVPRTGVRPWPRGLCLCGVSTQSSEGPYVRVSARPLGAPCGGWVTPATHRRHPHCMSGHISHQQASTLISTKREQQQAAGIVCVSTKCCRVFLPVLISACMYIRIIQVCFCVCLLGMCLTLLLAGPGGTELWQAHLSQTSGSAALNTKEYSSLQVWTESYRCEMQISLFPHSPILNCNIRVCMHSQSAHTNKEWVLIYVHMKKKKSKLPLLTTIMADKLSNVSKYFCSSHCMQQISDLTITTTRCVYLLGNTKYN